MQKILENIRLKQSEIEVTREKCSCYSLHERNVFRQTVKNGKFTFSIVDTVDANETFQINCVDNGKSEFCK